MTRAELEAENALLRELVTQYQAVRWIRLVSQGIQVRHAVDRLEELERWAAVRGVKFEAPHDVDLPAADMTLTCSCGDRLAVAGGSAAVAAATGYFRVLHGGRKCRVERAA